LETTVTELIAIALLLGAVRPVDPGLERTRIPRYRDESDVVDEGPEKVLFILLTVALLKSRL